MLENRVRETSNTTGTGTFSLAGAIDASHKSFVDACGDGQQAYYVILHGDDYEIGLGVVDEGTPDTLTRTTVYESSNANNHVSFTAGIKQVFLSLPKQFFSRTPAANLVPRANGSGFIDPGWIDGLVIGPSPSTEFAIATFADTSGAELLDNPDFLISGTKFKGKSSYSPGNVVTGSNFDLDEDNVHFITLTGDPTFTVSNADIYQRFLVKITQDATGGRVPTWWDNITWHGYKTPRLEANASSWFGFIVTGTDGYGNPTFDGFNLSKVTPKIELTSVGADVDVDLSKSDNFKLILHGNRTLTFSNPTLEAPFQLELVQNEIGSKTVTWPADVKFQNNITPTLTITAYKSDRFIFAYTGSVYHCLGVSVNLGN